MARKSRKQLQSGSLIGQGQPAGRSPATGLPQPKRLLGPVKRADFLCVGFILLVTLGFFFRGFVDPKKIIREDAAYAYQPFYTFVADEITHGRFPHWNPYVSFGVPFHAGLHGAVMYPLRLPLNWLSYPSGYIVTLCVHFFLLGTITYAFMRVTLRCGPLPALIGALSFSFGGFALGRVTHPNWIQSYPWLILTIFLIAQAIERSSWACAVAAGIPLALMAFACGVHLLLVVMSGLVFWGLAETLLRLGRKVRRRGNSLAWAVWPAVAVSIALLLGVAIGMAQLWPGMYQTARSLRSEASWKFITEFCSHPLRAPFRLIVPFFYGNYRLGYWGDNNFHGQCYYAGLAPLFAAILAILFCWRNRWVPRLVVMILIAGLVAAGRYLPVYRLLFDYLPFFNRLRNPARFFMWVQFGIACLGAIGL